MVKICNTFPIFFRNGVNRYGIFFKHESCTSDDKNLGVFRHIHHSSLPDQKDCNCQEYLNLCIDAAREIWDNENFIFFRKGAV